MEFHLDLTYHPESEGLSYLYTDPFFIPIWKNVPLSDVVLFEGAPRTDITYENSRGILEQNRMLMSKYRSTYLKDPMLFAKLEKSPPKNADFLQLKIFTKSRAKLFLTESELYDKETYEIIRSIHSEVERLNYIPYLKRGELITAREILQKSHTLDIQLAKKRDPIIASSLIELMKKFELKNGYLLFGYSHVGLSKHLEIPEERVRKLELGILPPDYLRRFQEDGYTLSDDDARRFLLIDLLEQTVDGNYFARSKKIADLIYFLNPENLEELEDLSQQEIESIHKPLIEEGELSIFSNAEIREILIRILSQQLSEKNQSALIPKEWK
ncbi:MAG: hypothetical protein J4452_01885 [Candidatus Aenigmarchaeota archaeon]|nr:hypothetical protein [Candidatus Aenigmarchaeota archaeon]